VPVYGAQLEINESGIKGAGMFKSIAALGALSVAAFSAQADVALAASLTGFNFQLIDLDVFDGVAPALTFLEGQSQGAVTNLLSNQSTSYDSVFYRLPFQSDARSATLGPFTSAFELAGTGGLNGFNLRANTTASNLAPEAWTYMFANASLSGTFALTPKTQLLVSVVSKAEVHSSMLANRYLNDITAQAIVNLEGYGLRVALGKA